MIDTSHFVQLPYTPDLTEGGIAYALCSLPCSFQRGGSSIYDHLRRVVGETAVEILFRRYLSEQKISFEVKSALPFSGPERYDVLLGGRRCEVKSILVGQDELRSRVRQDPQVLLKAQALVASDQHAAEGPSPRDLYLFAFLFAEVTDSQEGYPKANAADRPRYLMHVMPEAWNRPSQWHPLGRLVLKSESEITQTIEIGGQDEGRAMRSCTVELPPRTRLEVPDEFFSLSYIHKKPGCPARLGVHSPVRRDTYLIEAAEWRDIWVHGTDVWLAGYITREEFRRRAAFLPAGAQVFPHSRTRVKHLAVPVSDLRPLAEIFEPVNRLPVVTAP